jgi:glycine oxidase
MKIGIIGCGIAGSTLAFELVKNGNEVVLFENDSNVSTSVAAGMVNPLVFRRMTLSWRIDEMLPVAFNFYTRLEKELKTSFLQSVTIRRFFASIQEKDYWKKKQHLPDFEHYMEELTEDDFNFLSEQNSFGTARVKQAFRVNSSIFYTSVLTFFEQKGILRKEMFDESKFIESEMSYNTEHFDAFVYCNGKDLIYSKFWNFLPIKLAKGQLLEVRWDNFSTQESWNRKCFMIPNSKGNFDIGSTYEWDLDNTDPTESAKELILNNLKSLKEETPTIVNHTAGIRPTSLDRRPMLGKHPTVKNLYCFNGLGTKGYLLAPLLAKEMAAHICHDTPLNNEIDLNRFVKTQVVN